MVYISLSWCIRRYGHSLEENYFSVNHSFLVKGLLGLILAGMVVYITLSMCMLHVTRRR